MFVLSLQGKTMKYVGAALAVCFVMVVSLCLLPAYDTEGTAYVSVSTNETIRFRDIRTDADRLDFIAKFGIKAEEVPLETITTKIPKKFDAVFDDYNAVQKAQGLDLEKYRGKKVTRYTYKILNYPVNADGEPDGDVFLNLIMYKNRVIAGDISSTDMGGFVRTFCDFETE